MAVNLIYCTCCFVILTFCFGSGDGRWKERDKEKLYHDVDVFKRMAEKIEYEIEAFYEDYPDEQIKGDDIENVHQVYVKSIQAHKTRTKYLRDKTETAPKFSNATEKKIEPLEPGNVTQSLLNRATFQNNEPSKVASSNWPKFEEILAEIGKRYDWKNDRWIKVKRKLKRPPIIINAQVDNSIGFHEKHNFRYRTVKLNRKSRRNVVIAVTAVR